MTYKTVIVTHEVIL